MRDGKMWCNATDISFGLSSPTPFEVHIVDKQTPIIEANLSQTFNGGTAARGDNLATGNETNIRHLVLMDDRLISLARFGIIYRRT